MFFKRFLPFVFCMSLFVASCKENKKVIKQTEVTFKKEGDLIIFKSDSTQVTLDIEIADTDFDIQTGLMYRDSMKDKQGMLFVFDDVTPRSFYMKNTKFPLDLIFIDDDKKIVSFQKNAQPFDETGLSSQVPVKYVLEINAGLSDSIGLQVGDSIAFTKK